LRKIHVLLPAWRAAEFIQPTLDSVAAQDHPDFEVIVSVDLCDDATHAICLRQAESDRRFRVIRQETRLGYVGNCNALLGEAEAEFAVFAFHDDILAPTFLSKLSAALEARPEAVLSYCDVDLTAADGKREHWVYTALDGVADRVARGHKVLASEGKWWVPNRGLFRLAAARSVGGLKRHGAGEFMVDWPWLFRLCLLGEFVRVPETLCFKFYKEQSISQGWEYSRTQFFEAAAACMRELWNSDLSSEEKLILAAPLIRWLAKLRSEAAPKPGMRDRRVAVEPLPSGR